MGNAFIPSLNQATDCFVSTVAVIYYHFACEDIVAHSIKKHKWHLPPQKILKMFSRLCILRYRYDDSSNSVVHQRFRVDHFLFESAARRGALLDICTSSNF
jgi:6-phosphogluconate dehydrogenase